MPAKKKGKRSSAAKKAPARKSASAKKAAGGRRSSGSSRFGKTAVKVLAGAAAGAVRAIIPPLEEAAGASERVAGSKEQGGQKRGKSAR